jgi:hypothetical protein
MEPVQTKHCIVYTVPNCLTDVITSRCRIFLKKLVGQLFHLAKKVPDSVEPGVPLMPIKAIL